MLEQACACNVFTVANEIHVCQVMALAFFFSCQLSHRHLLPSCTGCAAALNVSVFLLIGKTSALTLNIAGFIKDWLLIGMSAFIYGWVI